MKLIRPGKKYLNIKLHK